MLDEYPRKLRTALASWLILGVGFWGTTATLGVLRYLSAALPASTWRT